MMNQTVTYAIPSGKYNKKDGIANVPFTAQQGTSTQMYILAQSTMLDLIASCCTFFLRPLFSENSIIIKGSPDLVFEGVPIGYLISVLTSYKLS